MKSRAEYQRRRHEADLIGYVVRRFNPSSAKSYARAMMREDKRRYWEKKHRTLGPSYKRTLEVYYGKRARKLIIDHYYNRDVPSMYPAQFIIGIDLGSC